MTEFMILILGAESAERRLSPADTRALVENHASYERALREAFAFVDGERLRPSSEGRRVSVRDGQVHVEAGPFPEPAFDAYFLVRAASLDEAVALTEGCPLAPGAELEVRPVMNGHLKPEKANEPGRLFGYTVLGRAPDEAAWSALMDRIDVSTRDRFPSDRFLGGARLHAPSRGKRTVFDGPWLESKEVIGGLFFLRMQDLDDAVRWAGQSEFMTHGTLEVRELWRS
jgi:hypothetical protein